MSKAKKDILTIILEDKRPLLDLNQAFERIKEYIREYIKDGSQDVYDTPISDFCGLTLREIDIVTDNPFSDDCVVVINNLSEEQYDRIPLIRQILYLLYRLETTNIKLTKRGWLPLKVVAEAYTLGRRDTAIVMYGTKRITEYDAKSVWMARCVLKSLGWIKIRKGILSITAKGKKALKDIDRAANTALRAALLDVGLHTFDDAEDDKIGNNGLPFSALLLQKFGNIWHTGEFYQRHYEKAYPYPDVYNIYATRVFSRLFYWLGIVDFEICQYSPLPVAYRKTDLLAMIFSFKKAESGRV